MAVFKCKMCGGALLLNEGSNVAECEYCGSRQTVPTADNEKKMALFNRANRLRAGNEFDKAAGVYETIIADFPEEAEAYWGLILCQYGIEYVDDPATGKKVPTCHRSSFDSVMDDGNFELVMEYADPIARRVYREEAKQLEELRKGIVEVSSHEEPYDIFICYKETDDNGERTLDSVLAQSTYDMLTENGYRVFFSRISLEDKLGVEYEPYIFAALNSAKIMLAFGTDYDYYNAVWVKNEWSRFLRLMGKDKSKRLIPCYRNIDAYDMPREFQKLQSQDMGKVGADQDLLRAIKKLLPRNETNFPIHMQQGGPNVNSLLKRAKIFLSQEEWNQAKEYYNRVLDIDPENSEAYVGLMLAGYRFAEKADFEDAYVSRKITPDKTIETAKHFSKGELETWFRHMEGKYIRYREERRTTASRMQRLFGEAINTIVGINTDGTLREEGNYSTDYTRKQWTQLVAVSAGYTHVVGLKANGTVVAMGSNKYGQCDVSGWRDIIAISAGEKHTVGLRCDGTVVATELIAGRESYEKNDGQCDVSGWRDIVAICAAKYHTVGLRSDGTVVATDRRWCNVSKWTDIVAISANAFGHRTVGLKADGTVVAVNVDAEEADTIGQWTDIAAISVGSSHIAGLRADGTAVAVGYNRLGQCNVSDWAGIAAVIGGSNNTFAIRTDGTMVATELVLEKGQERYYKSYDVSSWRLFDRIEDLEDKLPKLHEQWKKEYPAASAAETEKQNGTGEMDSGTIQRLALVRNKIAFCQKTISASIAHTIGLKTDGTALVTGSKERVQSDVKSWSELVAVCVGENHTVGLKADGTVIAAGKNSDGQCDVSGWTKVVEICATESDTYGLRPGGTVLRAGAKRSLREVSDWNGIIFVSARYDHVIGLKDDGTAVASGYNGDGECNVQGWKDLVAISAGRLYSVGLRSDGTVVATGRNDWGQCEVSDWTEIVAVSAGSTQTVGLKADGTVVAVGNNDFGQCNVSGWTDIVAVCAGYGYTIGVRKDGRVLATGTNKSGQINITSWKLFRDYTCIAEDRQKYKELKEQLKYLNMRKGAYDTELANLKGLFTGKRRKELETEIASMNTQITDLKKQIDFIRS